MRKVLEALQIHRDEDGAHVVEHHHYDHPSEEHRFKGRNQAAAHILNNLERLEPAEWGELKSRKNRSRILGAGRPASLDYGSTRASEIQGRRK